MREEVLRLVQAGLSNKEIAQIRGVSEQAVKRQVSALLTAFGVDGRFKLIRLAYEQQHEAAAVIDGGG